VLCNSAQGGWHYLAQPMENPIPKGAVENNREQWREKKRWLLAL
jgi:hypothetical protein